MKLNQLVQRGLWAMLLALSGCTTARMALPPDFESRSEAFPCRGRNTFSLSERFSFGPYQVADVHRGWSHRSSWTLIIYERAKARQQYEFTLQAPSGNQWQGQAATGVREEDFKGTVAGGELTWELDRDVNFVTRLGHSGQTNAWTLALAAKNSAIVFNGTLSDGAVSYRVAGTRQLAGTAMPLSENAGVVFYDGMQPVAAVDLLNAGSVHFATDLTPVQREPLAAAAAALLLYRDITQDP